MPCLRQRNNCTRQGSTLQDHAHRTFHQGRLDGQTIGHCLADDIDESIPVWSQHDHVVLSYELQERLFQFLAPGSHLTKAGGQDNDIANPERCGLLKDRVNEGSGYHNKGEIDMLPYIA